MVAGVTELLPTSASNSFKTNAITGKFLWLRGLAAAYTDRAVHRGGMTVIRRNIDKRSENGVFSRDSSPCLFLVSGRLI
jgi:hypothetical protein